MFSVTEMQGFKLFNMDHIVTLVIFFAFYVALIMFRKQLMAYKKGVRWTIILALIACEISIHTWFFVTDQWDIGDLPLQLCSFSTFIALYLFWKKKVKAFYLLYFIGTLPPILAMVTPDMLYVFPHFRFIEYFLHHAVIPLSVLYFILFEGYRVPRKAVISSFFMLNIIAVPIFILNLLLDTNFFFLANPTETKTLLNFFGSGIMYYINLEIAVILVFFLTYTPMAILQKREKVSTEKG